VPQSYVPEGVVMPAADCSAELFCVPRELVSDPTARPAQCSADLRGPGLCVPQCIAEALGPLLTVQAGCNTGEQCYPCALFGGSATGACAAP
jgi:hypothetical protein